jgi:hypothetical protein
MVGFVIQREPVSGRGASVTAAQVRSPARPASLLRNVTISVTVRQGQVN